MGSPRVFVAGLLCAWAAHVAPSWAQQAAPSAAPAAPATPAPSKFDQVTQGTKKAEGLWTIYYKEQQILVDIKSSQLNQDFLMLTTIARGISSNPIIGGMTWGDDVLWTFRKVGDKMHVVRRNVRFKARPGSPEATAVQLAYTDSVLYALPIVADSPGGSLVDMTRIFFSDDEQIGRMMRATFAMDRTTVAKVKAFKKNVELQIAAVYVADPSSGLADTVPDPRGVQVIVHYSISQLPNTGYRPRKADDRVGYFLVATKDFSDNSDDQHFVRYITRWDLQKADPSAKLSPPKEPVIFHLEKTVPINLRPIVRSAIEEWNKAFEKIGFANAIEVRQQRDEDDWDPEDVSYNTFRWITADAGFAMGPSRVNPLNGQILDADIIFDASFLRFWRQDYENLVPPTALVAEDERPAPGQTLPFLPRAARTDCQLSHGMQQQMGFAAAALLAQGLVSKRGELPEEFLQQALKEVVMHEVGHTLGLRHNFKASAWKTLQEIEDAARPLSEPTVASVMDYSPVNINPAGAKQSAYYSTTLGPYDVWAIEYGYKTISGDENAELAKIAARSGEPGLDYATDEDTDADDPDPLSNRFDLGKDPLAYSQRQMKTVQELLPKLLDRAVENGEGYQRLRQAFSLLIGEYWRTAAFAARMPGGIYVHRDHKGDNQARAPFKVVEPAQQRAAMKLVAEQALAAPKLDPQLLSSLASTRWYQWGIQLSTRTEFGIHDTVQYYQNIVVSRLLNDLTLMRLLDGEQYVAADQDAYTLAEHLRSVVDGVFSELSNPAAGEFTSRKAFIASYRRNLQQQTIKQLIQIAGGSRSVRRVRGAPELSTSGPPEDARVLARMHLTELRDRIKAVQGKADLKLDDYTKAHLQDLADRIQQVLEARATVSTGSSILIGF